MTARKYCAQCGETDHFSDVLDKKCLRALKSRLRAQLLIMRICKEIFERENSHPTAQAALSKFV